MKLLRKCLSLLLALSLLAALTLPALASPALGDDLTAADTLLNQQTQLSTNVFWSSAYSDYRTENLITYTPNYSVTPIVTYGSVLTDRNKVTDAARQLESEGYRVVAGINGDFYNVNNGLPIGLVVSRGKLRSTDGGYFAIGFRADGSAILGRPGVSVSADLGYVVYDAEGNAIGEAVRPVVAVNKARTSKGIYLYTYDFNAAHTTGSTQPGVDLLCTIQEGRLSIGESVTLVVEEVLEAETATPIGENQMVLTANLEADPFQLDGLRNTPVGSVIRLDVGAADPGWNDVEYAAGALYALVENGAVGSGLEKGAAPRTAVGQRYDGSLIFYTIDGRKSGHSVGASMTQVAERLIELGCVNALCLDGGGSTTLSVTQPTDLEAKTVNKPSDGRERAVSNQIFLVASSEPTGELSHFYVSADHTYVLAGSSAVISAAAIDTNFIPMDRGYSLTASDGTLEDNVLTTPLEGGDVVVTAESGESRGTTTVHAVTTPDAIAIRNSQNDMITTLTVAPNASTQLTATAAYRHFPLKADPEAFTWTVESLESPEEEDGEARPIGEIDAKGLFTSFEPGEGRITVSAGGMSATIDVTVAETGPEKLEDFEGETTIFRGNGEGMNYSLNHNANFVRMGRGSGKMDYNLDEAAEENTLLWRFGTPFALDGQLYKYLTMWVYGDGSGNKLELRYNRGDKGYLSLPLTTLDFTSWKQISVPTDEHMTELQAICILGQDTADAEGNPIETVRAGTIYLDHVTASYDEAVDNTSPAITLELDSENWSVTGTVSDAIDGIPPAEMVQVTLNGAPAGEYDPASGQVTVYLPGPGESQEANRITVTARDVSGNIGRASLDTPPYNVDHKFTDTADYWGADYCDFLYNAGVTTGYEDGTFRPDQNITRAQFSVMLARYLKLDTVQYAESELPFADLSAIPAYALPSIQALYAQGIVNGTPGPDGQLRFNPGGSLTRAQAAAMIGRTQEKGYAVTDLTFTDAAAIPSYAAYYIQTMLAQGVISGYQDGTFRPAANITRGQMAKILYTLM
ncbi:MAG: surface layer protein [Oscillibacter sp.]|nr:surface layer protein [Oscillibacter sp.]